MRGERGFSLIEVLIAAAVMAVGLAGLARLSLLSVVDTAAARDRTTAVMLAAEAAAGARLGSSEALHWNDTASASAGGCQPADCSPSEFTRSFAAGWAQRVADRLPGGEGVVCRDATPRDGTPGAAACDDSGPLVTKLFWRDRNGVTQAHVSVLP